MTIGTVIFIGKLLNNQTKDKHMNALQAMGIVKWQLRAPFSSELVSGTNATMHDDSWVQLRERISQCQACELHQGRTQTVFGVGHEKARLLIVGEAPGYYEDKQGEPFVGRAGQLLNAMLKAIGLERQQVFITNVLKCRPPANRDPQGSEVQQCTPFLDQQIAHIKPQLIVALGRHAAHYLLNTDQTLAKLRQADHRFQEETPLVVTYHPAYLLRNPKDKAKAYLDWCHIASQLQHAGNELN